LPNEDVENFQIKVANKIDHKSANYRVDLSGKKNFNVDLNGNSKKLQFRSFKYNIWKFK